MTILRIFLTDIGVGHQDHYVSRHRTRNQGSTLSDTSLTLQLANIDLAL